MTDVSRYFIIHNLAKDDADIIRYAALLRGTESAWQALSYGLESITIFAQVGGVYLNFGLWGLALLPAWLLLRDFGADRLADQERTEDLDVTDVQTTPNEKTNIDDA